jgi:hypothetical protein
MNKKLLRKITLTKIRVKFKGRMQTLYLFKNLQFFKLKDETSSSEFK